MIFQSVKSAAASSTSPRSETIGVAVRFHTGLKAAPCGKEGSMTVKWLSGDGGASPQQALRDLLALPTAVPVAGVYDGLSAVLAQRAGFKALYLSGAALSASMALPDLGLITLEEVWRAARTVVRASQLPVIVDCDTGFGESLNVMRAVEELQSVGVACIQIEDQEFPKKCGHLNDKKLVAADDMCRKIAAARKPRTPC
jgi:methylisocitrate lyase